LPREIKEGAIFIADAHYPHHGNDFLKILKALEKRTILTPQLFLMGDIFDLLFGYNAYIRTFSNEAITLINRLSNEIEIIYIEGNHDFCLKEIFPKVTLYPRESQPIHYRLNGQNLYLSHGDKYGAGFLYNVYSKLLRNRTMLTLLSVFEKEIIGHRMAKLKRKNICGDFIHYPQRFNKIIAKYPSNSTIIEGHFHQGIKYQNYLSLPSLACQKKIGIVENGSLLFREPLYNQSEQP